jgi:sec-independent protein translocase protein TatB
MFSFGWSEILLTVVVVIIVIGPAEIPNLLKQLGIFSKSLKIITRDFKKSLNELAEDGDINNIKKSLSDIKSLKNDFNIKNKMNKEINSIKDTVTFTDKEISEINDKILKD